MGEDGGDKHNPSDVLAGYALGHFLSAFINDAFLGLEHENDMDYIVYISFFISI